MWLYRERDTKQNSYVVYIRFDCVHFTCSLTQDVQINRMPSALLHLIYVCACRRHRYRRSPNNVYCFFFSLKETKKTKSRKKCIKYYISTHLSKTFDRLFDRLCDGLCMRFVPYPYTFCCCCSHFIASFLSYFHQQKYYMRLPHRIT